jgi:UDPglucose 6-dehydrogenase
VARLRRGALPIYEPRLQEIVAEQLATGRLRFTVDYAEGLRGAQFAFVCVGTPPAADGSADLGQVRAATASLARHTPPGARLVVVNKSTLPVGTGDWIENLLEAQAVHSEVRFAVISNPEFLREGSAVSDFLHPDRIVVGGSDRDVIEAVVDLYGGLDPQPPIVRAERRTAEMIKYASNAFLAAKISFINEMASICDRVGADVKDVAQGVGLDQRIGPRFLSAGVGYGGSCFPKDVMALERVATDAGVEPCMLRAVMNTNESMRRKVIADLRSEMEGFRGLRVGILGLAFKSDTDDVRESPALGIARTLLDEGALVRAYDPAAMANARRILPELELCIDAYSAAGGADVLLVLTEWPEFMHLDYARICGSMLQPVLLDGRNLLDPCAMQALGFRYRGIGRGVAPEGDARVSRFSPSREALAA